MCLILNYCFVYGLTALTSLPFSHKWTRGERWKMAFPFFFRDEQTLRVFFEHDLLSLVSVRQDLSLIV